MDPNFVLTPRRIDIFLILPYDSVLYNKVKRTIQNQFKVNSKSIHTVKSLRKSSSMMSLHTKEVLY